MIMQRPLEPNATLVSQYIQKFDSTARYEKDLTELFGRFPENIKFDDVLVKVSVLNAIYSTKIRDVFTVTRRILELEIDPKLVQRNPELVNEIAKTSNRREFSFATKYCSWHQPDAFPIFDRFAAKLIYEYQQVDKFSESFLKKDLKASYVTFKEIIGAFRKKYGLMDFGFKDLDKFLYSYGKEYFKKSI
jgi:hypothetical protein